MRLKQCLKWKIPYSYHRTWNCGKETGFDLFRGQIWPFDHYYRIKWSRNDWHKLLGRVPKISFNSRQKYSNFPALFSHFSRGTPRLWFCRRERPTAIFRQYRDPEPPENAPDKPFFPASVQFALIFYSRTFLVHFSSFFSLFSSE